MTWQTFLAFATPVGLYLVLGILNLLLGHKSQINSWAEANPRIAALMKLSRSLGLDPWMLVQSLSLLIRGRLPATMTAEPERLLMRPPPPSNRPPPPPTLVATLALALLALPGCNAAVNWPAVAKCVPTEELGRDIVDKIADILLRGGDYEQALEDLARQYGADGPRMVICVVNALLGDWTDASRPQAGPDKAAGVARARAFLKRAGTRVESAP